MRFIHMADIHFDSPFTVLTDKRDFGTIRNREIDIKERGALWQKIKNQVASDF